VRQTIAEFSVFPLGKIARHVLATVVQVLASSKYPPGASYLWGDFADLSRCAAGSVDWQDRIIILLLGSGGNSLGR